MRKTVIYLKMDQSILLERLTEAQTQILLKAPDIRLNL